MAKEVVVYIYDGILLNHKKKEIESVIVRWMNPEPVIQRAVSQKEKSKHCILMHIYGIYKNSTDEPIYREGWRHGHRERSGEHSGGRREQDKLSSSADMIHYHV